MKKLEDWAKSFMGKQMKWPVGGGRSTETSEVVGYEAGANGRGAWFILANGQKAYRQMPKN